jgi:hypothetical protein
MPAVSEQKIQVPIGFANVAGDDLDGMLQEDVAVLSPLFEHVTVTSPGQISRAAILFLYAHFNQDGFIQGLESRGIRQIVEATQARLVVVASPVVQQILQKVANVPGPKTANLVFTLNRNGQHFAAFFKTLFERMRDGEDMLEAWVELAPQGPTQPADVPGTILLAEAGKLVFPKPPAH